MSRGEIHEEADSPQSADDATDPSGDSATADDPPDDVTADTLPDDVATDQPPDDVPEQLPDDVTTDQPPDDVPEQLPDDVTTDQPSHDLPDKPPDDVPDQQPREFEDADPSASEDDHPEHSSPDTESRGDTADTRSGAVSETTYSESDVSADTTDTTDATDTESDADHAETLRRALGVSGSFLRVTARITFVGVSLLASLVRESDRPNPARRWFLLAGNRWAIVGSLVVSFFVGSLLLGLTNVIGIQESDFVTTMFSTIIAGLFSFVPIVVSVNNVALGRMFDGPDALRERVDGVRAFRNRVEAMAPDVTVSPTDPAGFLSVLAGTLLERTDRLAESVAVAESAAMQDEQTATEVEAFGDAVGRVAASIRDELDGTDPAVFDLLLPMMNHDYSQLVNEARSLRHRVEDPEVSAALADLGETLTALDVARQYFKTMYVQDELARLSRLVAYSGLTAFLSSTLVIMIYASGYPPVQHETPLLLLVTLSLAVAFAPFAILFAYVVRLATVVKRTAAPGAFTPQGERPDHVR
jgi:outer membrane biosynthesis protein TonB